jgi:hypothetical protein
MEPVAVAARTNSEVWVVNHLSDSVSVVDLSQMPPRVVRTLIVGDEPRDIVFAGTGGNRAFNHHRAPRPAAHRCVDLGRDGHGRPQLTTQGVGRADVWVFDATNLGTTFGGTPLRVLSFFATRPARSRPTAPTSTSPRSTRATSRRRSSRVCVRNGFAGAGAGLPQPQCPIQANVPGGVPGPEHQRRERRGARDRHHRPAQRHELGRLAGPQLERRFRSPARPRRVRVNANTFATGTIFHHVGTILFNMARNPVTGKIYVTNTESPNLTMFEGARRLRRQHACRGHLSETRITVLNPNGRRRSQHLNKHIDYSLRHTPRRANHALINAQAALSLATPLQPVVSSDGSTIYVPAFGSSKIGVFSTAAIEDPSFEANYYANAASANYITTTGGGPAGLRSTRPTTACTCSRASTTP